MAMSTGYSFLVPFLIIGMSSVVMCQYNSHVPTECKDQYFADPIDCTKFYVCVHGQPMSWSCPSPLHWNEQHKTCDWDYSANCAAANNNQHLQQPQQPTSQWGPQSSPSHQPVQQMSPWIQQDHQSLPPQQPQQQISQWGQDHQSALPQQPHQQINQWGNDYQALPPQQPQQQNGQWGHQSQPQQQQIQHISDWGHEQQGNAYNPSAYPQVNHPDNIDYPEYEDEEPNMNHHQPSYVQPGPSSMPAVPNQTNTKCGPAKKSVCYFTNWAWYRQGAGKFMPEDIDPELCTHVIYAFAVIDPNTYTMKMHDSWADIDNHFYEKVTALKQKGVKVSIAIGGWNDSQGPRYGPMLTDPQKRRAFVESAKAYVKKYNFDGLDLDLEYPGCWQGNCEPSRANEKAGFADLTKELSESFKPEGLILSAAVSASPTTSDAAYDIPTMSKYLDFINLMSYDYHGQWDRKTGHNAPFDAADNFNVKASVDYWLQKGAAPEKLILGLPTYGQSFTLSDPQNSGFNAPASAGQAGEYTKAAGTLAYYEICEKTKRDGWNVVRDPQNKIGPYATKGNQWVSFDDAENAHTKGKYICEKGLGGGMIWSLDFDDFKGSCGCGRYPILTALNQEIRGVGGAPVQNCT